MATTQDLVNYYAGLLILQYANKPRAYPTIQNLVSPVVMPQVSVQTISFSGVAASGVFYLGWNGNMTAAINWNDAVGTIQTKLQAVPGLSAVTVSGSVASQLLTVTFTSVPPPASFLSDTGTTLATSGPVAITLAYAETDVSLPLAIQNAFNVTTAVGTQLDILGKYVGVSRQTFDFAGPVTLSDADFRSLILVKVIQNNSGSSLYDIQNVVYGLFAGALRVFDGADMHMDYFFESSAGSMILAEVFVEQGLLPKPMGVQLGSLIYAANINNFWGMRNYAIALVGALGFSQYSGYNTSERWLSYTDALAI